MLNTALRVESGLTYGARARIDRLARPGAAAISSFTRTDATGQALDLTLEIIDRLHAKGIDRAMLDSGRNYMLGQFPPQLETNGQLAAELTELALHGLSREQIEGLAARLAALDTDAVNAARGVFPTRDTLAIVLIGDAERIRATASTYGKVTEMALSDPRFAPEPR
jgi:predicted Zn-dependent peptidase